MAWLGFNTQDSLKAIVQPVTEWSVSSKPHTLSQIETINTSIYYQIIMFLKGQGINTDNLTAEDIKGLSLINDLWAGCIIAPAKAATNKDEKGETWDKRYKDMLNNFVKYKSKVSEDAAQDMKYDDFGLAYTDIEDVDPIFGTDDVW